MNYVIEDNIDFYHELNKKDGIIQIDDSELCLITRTQLDNNYLDLECGHKFNYIALYNNCIQFEKRNKEQGIHDTAFIQCPYCRHCQRTLLPYIRGIGIKHKAGITYKVDSDFTKEKNKEEGTGIACERILNYGIQKGCLCGKNIFQNQLCKRHYNLKIK